MVGPTSNPFLEPRFRALQFHFLTAVHRDIHYASRLVSRMQCLGERTGSANLVEIARALQILLLREAGRRWAWIGVDDERETCTG